MKHCPNPTCSYRVAHGDSAEFRDEVETCRACGGPLRPGPADTARKRSDGAGLGWLVSTAGLAAVPVLSRWFDGVSLTLTCGLGLMIWSACFMGQRRLAWLESVDRWLSTRFPVRPLISILIGGAGWGAGDAIAHHRSMAAYLPDEPGLRLGVAAVLVISLGRGMVRPARLRTAQRENSLAVALGVAWPMGGAWSIAAATMTAWIAATFLDPPWATIAGGAVLVAGALVAYRPRALRAELAAAEPSEADVAKLVRRARLQSVAVLLALWLAAQPFADRAWEAGLLALAALWLAAALADLIRGAAGDGELTRATPTAALLLAVRRQGRVAQGAVGTILGNLRTSGSVTKTSP